MTAHHGILVCISFGAGLVVRLGAVFGALREALVQEAWIAEGKFFSSARHKAYAQEKESHPRAPGAHTFRVLEPADPTKLDEPEHVVFEPSFILADGLVRVVRDVGRADIDGRPV